MFSQLPFAVSILLLCLVSNSSAAEITMCNATLSLRSGDSVFLKNCNAPLDLIVTSTTCENISIRLFQVTLQSIDWTRCDQRLRTISILIQQATVLDGTILSSQKTLTEVDNVNVTVEHTRFNLTASTVSSSTGSLQVISILMKNETNTFMTSVHVALSDCTVVCRRLFLKGTYFVSLAGYLSTGSDVTVTMDKISLDAEDITNTTFRPLLLEFYTASDVTVAIRRSTFRITLVNTVQYFVIAWLRCNSVFEGWTGLNLTVESTSFLLDVVARQQNVETDVRVISLGSYGMRVGIYRASHVVMRDVQTTLRTSSVSVSVLIVQALTNRSTAEIRNCSLALDWDGTQTDARLVSLVRMVESSAVVFDSSVDVRMRTRLSVSYPYDRFALCDFADLYFADVLVRRASLNLQTMPTAAPSTTVWFVSTMLILVLSGSTVDASMVVEQCRVMGNVGILHPVAEGIAALAVALATTHRASVIVRDTAVWADVSPQFAQKTSVKSLCGIVGISPNPPAQKVGASETAVSITQCRVHGSAFFTSFMGAFGLDSCSVKTNLSVAVSYVTVAVLPLPYAPPPLAQQWGIVSLGNSDCDREEASKGVDFRYTLRHSVAVNGIAMISSDDQSLTGSACRLSVHASNVTTTAATTSVSSLLCSSTSASVATSAAVSMSISSTRLKSVDWLLENSQFGQCTIFPLNSASLFPANGQQVVLRGCIRMRDRRVSPRTLGAPLSVVDHRDSVCGPSQTVSVTVSPSEDMVHAQVAQVRRVSYLVSVGAGAVSVAVSVLTQWGSGIAVQRSVGVMAATACAGDAALDEPVDAASSPLQLRFGPSHGASARGAVLGNLVLCFVSILIGFLFVAFEWRRRRDVLATSAKNAPRLLIASMAETGMPISIAAPVCGVLLPPTVTLSVSLFWTGSVGDVVLGLVGILFSLMITGCILRLLCVRSSSFPAKAVRLRRRRRSSRRSSRPREKEEGQQTGGQERSFLSSFLTALTDILFERRWVWRNRQELKKSHPASFVGIYGSLFDGCRHGAHWWSAVEFAAGVSSAAACGLLFTDRAACDAVVGSVGAMCAVLALVVVFWKPFDTMMDTLQSFSANAIAAVGAAIALGSTDAADDASFGLLWAQTAVALLSLVLSVTGVLVEEWTTRRFPQEPRRHRGCRLVAQLWRRFRGACGSTAAVNESTSSSDDNDSDSKSARRRQLKSRNSSAAVSAVNRSEDGTHAFVHPPQVQANLQKLLLMICSRQQQQQTSFGRLRTQERIA